MSNFLKTLEGLVEELPPESIWQLSQLLWTLHNSVLLKRRAKLAEEGGDQEGAEAYNKRWEEALWEHRRKAVGIETKET